MESSIIDPGLAEFGCKEIEIAENEMPGLIACRNKYKSLKPFKGLRITGSLHMTIQTAVLIETLIELGAQVRWCSCNIFSTQDHAAAAVAKNNSCVVFAWAGETIKEYWNCTLRALTWPNESGPHLLVDDGGDATLLIHEGVKAEKEYEQNGKLPCPDVAETEDMKAVLNILRDHLKLDPQKWRRMASTITGVAEETTTGVRRLTEMAKAQTLLFPAINVNDSVTKSKFDNIYGCRHSLIDGIMRATDMMIAAKKVVICGYGDVGKGCALAMKGAGARVFITEIDPICALQACMDGLQVELLENIVKTCDIFVTATGNKNVIRIEHMVEMKHNAVVCNIGHFDNEIDVQGLLNYPGIQRRTIKPQVDQFQFPEPLGHQIILLAEGRLVNLGCATGHPSFVMSLSFTNQILALMHLLENSQTLKKEVYVLPKILDEKVASLHLKALGATLTELTDDQAQYIGVHKNGPFKPETYRY